jgi:MoaA/NifB/PqqE/SkfB family radical SAM enzyme
MEHDFISAPLDRIAGFLDKARQISPKSAALMQSKLDYSAKRKEFKDKNGFAPLNITISPSYKCNLKCVNCYSESSAVESQELDDETIDRVIIEASEKWDVPFFTITGGECLTQAIEIAARHPKKIFQIYTNGTLINEERADIIAEMWNLFPLVGIEYSREDIIKGKGHCDIKKVMGMLAERDILWGVSFVLTSANSCAYENDDFMTLLVDSGALFGRFLTYMPTGTGADLYKIPSREQRRMQGEAVSKADMIAIDYMNNPDSMVKGCAAAGLRYLHVDPYGDVYPCVFAKIPAEFNLIQAYSGQYEGINCLEHILVKDPMMIKARETAKSMDANDCCPILKQAEKSE